MVYKRYYSPFSGEPISPHNTNAEPCKNHSALPPKPKGLDFGGNISTDDIILTGILLILFADNKNEKNFPLILALAYLLITG